MSRELLLSHIGDHLNVVDQERELAANSLLQWVVARLKFDQSIRIRGIGVFQLKKEPLPREERRTNVNDGPINKRTLIYAPLQDELSKNVNSAFITFDLDELKIDSNDYLDKVFSLNIDRPLIPIQDSPHSGLDSNVLNEEHQETLEEKIRKMVNEGEILQDYNIFENYILPEETGITTDEIVEDDLVKEELLKSMGNVTEEEFPPAGEERSDELLQEEIDDVLIEPESEQLGEEIVEESVEFEAEQIQEEIIKEPVEPEFKRPEEEIVEESVDFEVEQIQQEIIKVPVEPESERLGEEIVEESVDFETEQIQEEIIKEPVEPEVERPEEEIVEESVEFEVEQIQEEIIKVPVEPESERLGEEIVEESVDFEAEQIQEETIEEPAEPEVVLPEEEIADIPLEDEVALPEEEIAEESIEFEVEQIQEEIIKEPVEPEVEQFEEEVVDEHLDESTAENVFADKIEDNIQPDEEGIMIEESELKSETEVVFEEITDTNISEVSIPVEDKNKNTDLFSKLENYLNDDVTEEEEPNIDLGNEEEINLALSDGEENSNSDLGNEEVEQNSILGNEEEEPNSDLGDEEELLEELRLDEIEVEEKRISDKSIRTNSPGKKSIFAKPGFIITLTSFVLLAIISFVLWGDEIIMEVTSSLENVGVIDTQTDQNQIDQNQINPDQSDQDQTNEDPTGIVEQTEDALVDDSVEPKDNVERTGLYRDIPNDVQTVNQVYFDGSRYTIQVSSWKTKTIAENEVRNLRSKNFDAFIFKKYLESKKGTWHRVRIGYFNSLEDAEDFIKNNKL